jgi:hypothetical protein
LAQGPYYSETSKKAMTHPSTHQQRNAVDHEHLALHQHSAEDRGDERHNVGQFVQPAIEVCQIEPSRQVVGLAQDAHRSAFMRSSWASGLAW